MGCLLYIKGLITPLCQSKQLAYYTFTSPHPQVYESIVVLNRKSTPAMKFPHLKPLIAFGATVSLIGTTSAGPLAYGVCQSGCAAVVMACYSAAGFTWGATLAVTAPATIILCNSAFGQCSAACAVVALTPTP
jgi:hypothetical protein